MRLPKVRGFKSPHPKPETVRWDKIVKRAPGGLVDKEKLWRWGLISSPRAHVKVVGPATKPKRSYTLRVEGVTKTVRQAIESSGGKIELPRAKTPAGKK
jgi:ribosomal protein L15